MRSDELETLLRDSFWNGLSIGREDQMAFLLNQHGKVIRYTDSAAAFVSKQDGIGLRDDRLRALNTNDDLVVEAIVAQAVHTSAARPGSARISRRSGKSPLIFLCLPLAPNVRMAPIDAAALAVVTDPTAPRNYPDEIYKQAFGLTGREVSIVKALLNGHSVETTAATLGITLLTARTHLRNIFEKTGTGSQSALVRLLGKLG